MLDYRGTRRRRRARALERTTRDGLTHHRRTDPATRARVRRRPPPPPSPARALRRRPRPLARASASLSPSTPRRRRRVSPPPSSPTAREPTRRSTPRSPRPRSLDFIHSPWSRPTRAAARRTRASSLERALGASQRLVRDFSDHAAADASVDSSSESTPIPSRSAAILKTSPDDAPIHVTARRRRDSRLASRAREEIFFPPRTEEYSVADARARPSNRWARTPRMTSKTMKTTTISGRAPDRAHRRAGRSPPPLSRRCSSPKIRRARMSEKRCDDDDSCDFGRGCACRRRRGRNPVPGASCVTAWEEVSEVRDAASRAGVRVAGEVRRRERVERAATPGGGMEKRREREKFESV